MRHFAVLDVESVGLHGEGFAFGLVVVDQTGRIRYQECAACNPRTACGENPDRLWVYENVMPALDIGKVFPMLGTPDNVRFYFRQIWREVRDLFPGVLMAADCPYPVETRFLAKCIDDTWIGYAQKNGPFPLIDVASVILAAGGDPTASAERLDNELPAHNPLADARQSARLLVESLAKIERSMRLCGAMHPPQSN